MIHNSPYFVNQKSEHIHQKLLCFSVFFENNLNWVLFVLYARYSEFQYTVSYSANKIKWKLKSLGNAIFYHNAMNRFISILQDIYQNNINWQKPCLLYLENLIREYILFKIYRKLILFLYLIKFWVHRSWSKNLKFNLFIFKVKGMPTDFKFD